MSASDCIKIKNSLDQEDRAVFDRNLQELKDAGVTGQDLYAQAAELTMESILSERNELAEEIRDFGGYIEDMVIEELLKPLKDKSAVSTPAQKNKITKFESLAAAVDKISDIDAFKESNNQPESVDTHPPKDNKDENLINQKVKPIEVKPIKLPINVTKRFSNILNKEMKAAGVDDSHTSITIHFRDPEYSESSGGYHPVEVSVNPDGTINYITDYFMMGGDLVKDLDFDLESKLFRQYAADFYSQQTGKPPSDSNILAGRGMFKIWQKNFSDYYGHGAYDVEVKSDQIEDNQSASTKKADESLPEQKKSYGQSNTFVTKERAEILREKLKAKLGQFNSGIDPEMMALGAELAAFHIEAGARTFKDFAKNMMSDLGSSFAALKPYLRSWYNGARDMMEDGGVSIEGMDSPDKVRASLIEVERSQKPTNPHAEDVADTAYSNHYYELALTGKAPKNNNELRKSIAVFDNTEPTQERMKQAQEEIEVAMVRLARSTIDKFGHDTKKTFDKLLEQYNNQPLLNIRTSTSVQNQAYSTPAPIAYLASNLARIDKQSNIYEPTAGNGMLLIAAEPINVIANELSPERHENLQKLGFSAVNGDALTAKADGVFQPGTQDAVITNPPFATLETKIKKDGYIISKLDHQIAADALDAMADDGRAVLIIAANKETGSMSKADRIFFNWLYSQYNVADNFELDGKMYNRQGAGWPIRVITVAGRSASESLSPDPKTIERIGDWNELYKRYEKSIEKSKLVVSNNATNIAGKSDAGSENSISSNNDTNIVYEANGVKDSGFSGKRGKTGGASDRVGDTGANRNTINQPERNDIADNAVGSDGLSNGVDRLGDGEAKPSTQGKAGDAANAKTSKSDGNTKSGTAITGTDYQAEYQGQSESGSDGALVPVNMATSMEKALADLDVLVGGIDNFVQEKLQYKSREEMNKALMGLQIDSVGASIHAIENGGAVIIADQTGIGKGRQAAAVLRYAKLVGKTPVFMSVKPDLFTDMFEDLQDIGTTDANPFLMNVAGFIKDRKSKKRIFKNKATKHTSVINKIIETGEIPSGSDMVFTTYSQLNKPGNKQQMALLAIAKDSIIVMDESHNASGQDSNIGVFIQQLLADVHGVMYLSATYAKRPDNLPLYMKTGLSEAFDNVADMIEAAEAGGLGIQTIISNMLTENGQLFRRERSYAGVEIKTEVDTKNKESHTALANSVTERLRMVIQADKAFHYMQVKSMDKAAKASGKAIVGAGNKSSAGVSHTQFTSVVHNSVRQFVLSVKAETAAQEAIAAIKRGERPVIALERTMGSFLQEYQSDSGLSIGDSLEGFDYRTVLDRSLARSRRVTVKDARGEEETIDVPLEDLTPSVRGLFDRAQASIDVMDVSDIPVSPIDWIRFKIEEAGFSVREITGRSLMVDYSQNPPVLSTKTAEEKDRVNSRDSFNDGSVDAMILNVAGSTGISLHASVKFKDQRPRTMIVAQPMLDINVFMQMLGRVHRTGQKQVPFYKVLNLDIPAEIRPTAVLMKKLKSLSANTSSNTDSDTNVGKLDLMNKYGDKVVADYLKENKELAKLLNIDEVDQNLPGVAVKATGRLALLTVKAQENFYADIAEQYAEYIDFLNRTGQNELTVKTIPFDAKEKSSIELSPTKGDGVFGASSSLVKYDVKRQGRPMIHYDIQSDIDKVLNGKTPKQYVESITSTMSADEEKVKLVYEKALRKLQSEAKPDSSDKEAAALNEKIQSAKNNIDSLKSSGFDVKRKIEFDLLPGAMVSINVNEQQMIGVVGAIQHKNKSGSPYAMSKTVVTIYVNDAMRVLRVPMSKLYDPDNRIMDGPYLLQSLEEVFSEKAASESREDRYIVTGNILSAYSELESKGQVISFFEADGKVKQGILMPRKFTVEDGIKKDQSLINPVAAERFLLDNRFDTDIKRFGIASRDSTIRVIADGDSSIKISVPSSKKLGGKWFTDTDLVAITGDFITARGSKTMTVSVNGEKAGESLSYIMKKTGLYAPESTSEKARKSVKDNPMFSIKSKNSTDNKSIDRAEALSIIKEIAPNLKTAGSLSQIDVIVADTFKQLPASIQNEASKQGVNPEEINAVYHNGKIYINLVAMNNREDVERAMFHEATHKGLREMLKDKGVKSSLTRLMASIGAKNFNKIAEDAGIDLSLYREGLNSSNNGQQTFSHEQRSHILMDELLAHLGETGSKTIKQRALELIGKVREWLRSHGFPFLSKLGITDLSHLAKQARESGLNTQSNNESNVLFSLKAAPESKPSENSLPDETMGGHAQRTFQDGFNRVKKLQESILSGDGKVTESSDVYLAEERSSGIIATRLDDLQFDLVKPLINGMRKHGITLQQLDDFVMSMHAAERNDFISEINPNMPDGGSGLTTAEANKKLDAFDDQGITGKLNELSEYVYKINEESLMNLYDGGLIDQERLDAYRDQYDYYVPLKGKTGEDDRAGFTGQGFSVMGAGLKSAMGRGAGNIAESPVAHSIAQAESAIIRQEKTRIGKALVELMRDNPDPEFWTLTKKNYHKFFGEDGEFFDGFSEEPTELIENQDYHKTMGITANERELALTEGRPPKKQVVYRLDESYKFREDVFSVMIDGQLHQITIKDQILAEQLKKLNSNEMSRIVQGMGKVMRYLAMVYTALNPEFIFTNMQRDLQAAGIHLAGKYKYGMAAKVYAQFPGAVVGIWASTFRRGKTKNKMAALFEELKHEGGTIGFFGLESIESKVQGIQSELRENESISGKTVRSLKLVRDLVLDANLAVENGARLAAYKVAQEYGLTKKQSASLSKNLTVNFNRKGEAGPILNSTFLFSGAAIQGSALILSLLKHKGVQAIAGGMAAAGFALAAYNQAVGGDDDDDISKWEKISDYEKQTFFIIMNPDGSGDYLVKWRMAYGWNAFFYAGTAMHDLSFGQKTTVAGTAGSLMNAVLNAYNPIQGADILDTITPTIVKPIEQSIRNINFMGAPIVPENPFDRYERPDSDKARASTNEELKDAMKLINELTGGSDTTSGAIDVSPETIKHYIKWVTGGAGMTTYRTFDAISNASKGKDVRSRDIPIYRSFIGEANTNQYDTERYYQAIESIEAHSEQIKIYRNNQDDRLTDYRDEFGRIAFLKDLVPTYKKQIKQIRDLRRMAFSNQDYDRAEELKGEITSIMRKLLTRYDRVSSDE